MNGVKWLAPLLAGVLAGGAVAQLQPASAEQGGHSPRAQLAQCQEAAQLGFDALTNDSDGIWYANQANAKVYRHGGQLGSRAFFAWQDKVQQSYDTWAATDRDTAYEELIECWEGSK